MTDDPISQAGRAISEGMFRRGREIAREAFIEPTFDNDGEAPSVLHDDWGRFDRFQLIGALHSTVEEAAGILKARRLETARVRHLERTLAAAEAQIRRLLAAQTGGGDAT